jgi:hypothetical protein
MDPNLNKIGAPWWQEMLSRRQANKRLAQIGALTALLSSANIITGCDSDDDEDTEVERDAFDLQQKEGWNIGSTDKALNFPGKSNTDSMGSLDWSTYLETANLLKAYQPVQSSLQPYVVPTLVQVLSQPSFRGLASPVFSKEMKEAYSRGLGMKEILLKTKNPETMTIISDLPGPESVAFAAALSDVADVVITFDNWPHPLGVVKSHLTLGALLYYAQEVSQKAAKRKSPVPSVFVLDKTRLTPYNDADSQFDNRYIAKLPTAENLNALKVSGIFYAIPNDSQKQELDDINDDFATYKDKGLNISMLPLNQFQPSEQDKAKIASSSQNYTATGSQSPTNVYHYGGGGSFLPYFFMYYAFTRPMYMYPSSYYSRLSPPSYLSRPSYEPVRRPTMFSSSRVGGAKGIGKARPSGFGRVSTRVSNTGRTSGVRAGRSGSWGRSSGRGGG